ncbi:hypothetical protein TRFO_40536 [Tritrichomonas foetus]|uniref:NADPH--hemoprotein reductase n=1 Tax=Tritrichomonas foetus TaxID=1144522 RepID=A0A1J4J0P3_9EUKA|nr:hypothetical protein TRFO_40536 [Tritrichomonas foetus]|eukprot:OHS93144.1 hypothetical protein TRFO_40536 [Tritrichomonas foetus]
MSLPIVAYGSFRGKAHNYALSVASKYNVKAIPMNDVEISQILIAQTVIFIVSTWGKGVFPENAASFFAKLQKSDEDFSNVNFTVLGLGSSKHKLYDQAGRDLFKEMESKKAKPLFSIYEVDARAADHGESEFVKWFRELESHLPLPKTATQITSSFTITESSENYQIVPPNNFQYAHILDSQILTGEDVRPIAHEYVMQLPDSIEAKAGDHIDILPRNDPEVVSKVISQLCLNGDAVYEIKGESLIPRLVSIRELFDQYIDLNGLPTQFMINSFRQYADEEGKAKLELLHNPDILFPYLQNTSVADFIEEYAQYGVPPLDILISCCPHTVPRTYSVASLPSPENRIKLITHDLEFGNNRHGLCTNYLSKVNSTSPVSVSFVKGIYKAEADVPMILFGVGVGVAPLLSVIEDRKSRGFKSPTFLLFGFRHENYIRPLTKILEGLKSEGSLTDIFYAFSRDHGTEKKYYITDALVDNKDVVWEAWKDPSAAVYYCGPAKGIPERLKDVLEQIIIEKTGVDAGAAAKTCKQHTWFVESF